MKLNVKGLVFVGFAAAVFASAAQAVDKVVTSKQYVDTELAKKVDANAAITAGTAAKITYDAKGLVTAGAGLTAQDIPDISATYVTQEQIADTVTAGGLGLPTEAAVATYVAGELAEVDGTPYTSGVGVTVNNDHTIDNAGVRTVTEGSTNGTISVNTNGTTAPVAVHGLGDAAYKGLASSITSNDTGLVTGAQVAAYAESGAEVNTIEGVQVNGTDLTPDANDKVNITVATGDTTVGNIKVNGVNVTPYGLGTAAGANVATGATPIATGGTGLVTGGQVYDYVDGLGLASSATTVTHTEDTAVGAANKGVYVDTDGSVKAMTHTVDSDVPANAVFTDTTYTSGTANTITIDATNHTISTVAGSIASGNTGLVNGGDVYTAINGKTFEPSTTGCTAFPCALVMTAAGTYGWENIAQASGN